MVAEPLHHVRGDVPSTGILHLYQHRQEPDLSIPDTMQKRTATKISAVALAASTLIISIADWAFSLNLRSFGLRSDMEGFWEIECHHLCYPFIHAHPVHAAINGWVLLQIAWRTPLRLRHLVTAFVIAWSCPATVGFLGTDSEYIVGMSGVIYALFGMLMRRSPRPLRFNMIVGLWLVIGALAGSSAVGLHGFCYIISLTPCPSLIERGE